ncbi:GNAT family N-acetyltransferase [Microcoleus sp. herbarium7]|uniref:GNAT family N-acetyltransferase n=1 Tax=Microcoleus sp. herbarium7 TaxID=3055435 RepID=UPI003FA5B3F4
MLVGKLAVDRSMQGRGLGKRLLRHALENALNLSQNMGIYAVRVDAIDEQAKEFYKKCGFLEYQDTPWVHLTFADTSSGKLTIEISTAKRKDRGNTLDIPLRSR